MLSPVCGDSKIKTEICYGLTIYALRQPTYMQLLLYCLKFRREREREANIDSRSPRLVKEISPHNLGKVDDGENSIDRVLRVAELRQ